MDPGYKFLVKGEPHLFDCECKPTSKADVGFQWFIAVAASQYLPTQEQDPPLLPFPPGVGLWGARGDHRLLWRNWLARPTVNREVRGSSPLRSGILSHSSHGQVGLRHPTVNRKIGSSNLPESGTHSFFVGLFVGSKEDRS